MYIAMNRFKVEHGHEEAFEQRWLNREIHLKSFPGFISFQFLRGNREEDHTLYVSHTLWESHDDFIHWTNSEAFKLAHHQTHQAKRLTISPPSFEGYAVLQNIA